jgi:uncharacterized membrane protein
MLRADLISDLPGGSLMTIYLLALALGVVAGLRVMTVPAAVSWAAHLGLLQLKGSWLAFLSNAWVPWLLTALAIGELIADQLPTTPARTVPVQFGARIVTGAVAGGVVAMNTANWNAGAAAGAVGAVIGTLGGRAFRARLASLFGRDRPAAFIEDAVAIAAALLIVMALP